jgi:FkbM family methyltransferase
LDVFQQIFLEREYRCLDDVGNSGLIVDCGANVGYASAYFLTRHPNAQLIAVEPDPGNFAVLAANLAPFGTRCRTLCSAVWPDRTGLVMSELPFRDGREWARQVRPAQCGEAPQMIAVDLGSVLRVSGFERISILKMDIEGAEASIFASNYEAWLDKVDVLVIELHGPECESVFHRAISAYDFASSKCGELTVCRPGPGTLPTRVLPALRKSA